MGGCAASPSARSRWCLVAPVICCSWVVLLMDQGLSLRMLQHEDPFDQVESPLSQLTDRAVEDASGAVVSDQVRARVHEAANMAEDVAQHVAARTAALADSTADTLDDFVPGTAAYQHGLRDDPAVAPVYDRAGVVMSPDLHDRAASRLVQHHSVCDTHTTVSGCEADMAHHCTWIATAVEPVVTFRNHFAPGVVAGGQCVMDGCMTETAPYPCTRRAGCHWTGNLCVMDSCSRHEYRASCDDEAHCHWSRDLEVCRPDPCGLHTSLTECEGGDADEGGGMNIKPNATGPASSPGDTRGAGGALAFLAHKMASKSTRVLERKGFLVKDTRAAINMPDRHDRSQCVWTSGNLCTTDVCPFKESVSDCNDHGPTHGCVWRVGDAQCHRDQSGCARARTRADCQLTSTGGGPQGSSCLWNAETNVCFVNACPHYDQKESCDTHKPWCKWSAGTQKCDTDLCQQFSDSFACSAHGLRDGCAWRNNRCLFDACATHTTKATCGAGGSLVFSGASTPGFSTASTSNATAAGSTLPDPQKMCVWKHERACVTDACAALAPGQCAAEVACAVDVNGTSCVTRTGFCAEFASKENCVQYRLPHAPDTEMCEWGERDGNMQCGAIPFAHPPMLRTQISVDDSDIQHTDPDFFAVCQEMVVSVILSVDGDPSLVGARMKSVCSTAELPRERSLCEAVQQSFVRQLEPEHANTFHHHSRAEMWNEENFDVSTFCTGVAHAIQAHRLTLGPAEPPGPIVGSSAGSSGAPAGSALAAVAPPPVAAAAGSLPIATPVAGGDAAAPAEAAEGEEEEEGEDE
ncbi:unnamed protein product [Amoebophrya sp. A120]|nr:unnamed protein product [Amoebophrya sp. A120]|eukprot:GSA120T00002484001.1